MTLILSVVLKLKATTMALGYGLKTN